MPKKTNRNKRQSIKLDYKNMMADGIKDSGLTGSELRKLHSFLNLAEKSVKQKRDDGMLGFMLMPYDAKKREEIKKTADRIRREIENVVVIGPGGSFYASAAIVSALRQPFYNELPSEKRKAPRFFALSGSDLDELNGILETLDLKRTFFYVISKNGFSFSACASAGLIIKKMSLHAPECIKNNIIITASGKTERLYNLAEKHKINLLYTEENTAQDFSVLGYNGLLPAASCGINIDEILKGAAYMDSLISERTAIKNPAYMMAFMKFISERKFGRKINLIMPLSSRLNNICRWYEGLLKCVAGGQIINDGKSVSPGFISIAAEDPGCNYSDLQLTGEGINDKIITFMCVEKSKNDQNLGFEGIQKKFNRNSFLVYARYKFLKDRLASNGKPNMTLTVPEITEFFIGQLIYLFEAEAVFLAELYNVNAFEQNMAVEMENYLGKLFAKSYSAGIIKKQKVNNKYII